VAFATVADFLSEARVLLLDIVPPYRYLEGDLIQALNLAMSDAARLRPDLFINANGLGNFTPSVYVTNGSDSGLNGAPNLATVSVGTDGTLYDMAIVYYICGHAQLRDEEWTQDGRASAMLQKYEMILTGKVTPVGSSN
jgi:hypothetical protein